MSRPRCSKNFARRAALQHLQIQGCASVARHFYMRVPTFSLSYSLSPDSGGRAVGNLEPPEMKSDKLLCKAIAGEREEEESKKTKLRRALPAILLPLAKHAADSVLPAVEAHLIWKIPSVTFRGLSNSIVRLNYHTVAEVFDANLGIVHPSCTTETKIKKKP